VAVTQASAYHLNKRTTPQARTNEPRQQNRPARIPQSHTAVDCNQVIFKGLEIIGLVHRAMFETWYKMVALIQSGLHISPLITHHFKVDDLNKGLTR
jgi:threonine dehydrogenase-like Zn-dependent dehydrogenase